MRVVIVLYNEKATGNKPFWLSDSHQICGKGAPWTFYDLHPSKNEILVKIFLCTVIIFNVS